MSSFVAHSAPKTTDKTAYDFSLETLDGKSMPLSQFKGKVILLVNTASQCGFTPQYKGLEELYLAYKDKGLVIIGVPSNDFGAQEPGSADEIKQFCSLNYGVTFPMSSKLIVSGNEANSLYKWLNDVLGFGSAPKWNFHKFLIDTTGKPVDFFVSTTTPDSDKLRFAIDAILPNENQKNPTANAK